MPNKNFKVDSAEVNPMNSRMVVVNEDVGLSKSFQAVSVIGDYLKSIIEPVSKLTQVALEANDAFIALEKYGILPEPGTPWSLYRSDCEDQTEVRRYYNDEWADAKENFLRQVADLDVSGQAKDDFARALELKGLGFHHECVVSCMVLLEAEFRRKFERKPGDQSASLLELQKLIGSLPLGAAIHKIGDYRLFRTLTKHLYHSVSSPELLEKFTSSPIPNRHAAVHGIIRYNTDLNSLNGVIITVYALRFMPLAVSIY